MFFLLPRRFLIVFIILWCCCLFICIATNGNSTNNDEKKKSRDDIDWIAYLLKYPDLGEALNTKEEALDHYYKKGKKEGRIAISSFPSQPSYNIATKKINNAFMKSNNNEKSSSGEDRTMILYNLHPIDKTKDSHGMYEMLLNNLQIFLLAMNNDNDHERSNNFYLLNVIDSMRNEFSSFVKPLAHQWNVAIVERPEVMNDLYGHFRSLTSLRTVFKNVKFKSIIFLSNQVRGPLAYQEKGLWIRQYASLLHQQHTGIVGSTMICDRSTQPMIQSDVMMIRMSVVNLMISEFVKFKKSMIFQKPFTQSNYELGITNIALLNHWNISTLLHYHRMQQLVYNGTCLPGIQSSLASPDSPLITNPHDRCDIKAEEVLFFRWDSNQVISNYEKYNCDTLIHYMSSLLSTLKQQNESIQFHLTEHIRDGDIHHAAVVHNNPNGEEGSEENEGGLRSYAVEKLKENFDWRAYLEFYPDLGSVLSNKEDAFHHYFHNGRYENRIYPRVFPIQPGLTNANKKLTNFITKTSSTTAGAAGERTFIIYNLQANLDSDSYEVIINNIMIFHHAIMQDASSDSMNFYWINIIGESNLYAGHIDIHLGNQWNVAIVTRSVAPSDLFVHLRTFALLKHTLKHKFKYIFCLNSGARGPFRNIAHGGWLLPYQQLLYSSHIGIVGSTLVCEEDHPERGYIPLYSFMLRGNLLSVLLSEFGSFKRMNNKHTYTNSMYEQGFTHEMVKHGWKIASVLHLKRFNLPYYNNTCIIPDYPTQSFYVPKIKTPSLWCNILPEEIIFYQWNEQIFSQNYICPELRQRMTSLLTELQTSKGHERELKLRIAEVAMNAEFIDLYRDYDAEIAMPQLPPPHHHKEKHVKKDQVCFIVRSCKGHDMAGIHEDNKEKDPIDIFDEVGIEDLIRSLLRQSDPNWEAAFFVTDTRPFDDRLEEILKTFNDPRLIMIKVPPEYRPEYTTLDAGYIATDWTIHKYLYHPKNRCQWFSTTNADNLYGSNVVHSIKNHRQLVRPSEENPEMLLIPVDSRNFGEYDYVNRKTKKSWGESCKGIVSMLSLNQLTYTVQPRPRIGKVDLAAAFLDVAKFIEEDKSFSSFTDQDKFPCRGCQDGYLIEYLMFKAFWRYVRLPLQGLRSIVFHGPSPTWCLASGMIWFDHPLVNKVRCLPLSVVHQIRQTDLSPMSIEFQPMTGFNYTGTVKVDRKHSVFDWKHFDTDAKKVCLRFTEEAFTQYSQLQLYSTPTTKTEMLSVFYDPDLI